MLGVEQARTRPIRPEHEPQVAEIGGRRRGDVIRQPERSSAVRAVRVMGADRVDAKRGARSTTTIAPVQRTIGVFPAHT